MLPKVCKGGGKLVSVCKWREKGETDDDGGILFADYGHWEHDIEGSDRERKARGDDRYGGVEDAREVPDGVFHLADDEADLFVYYG